MAQVGPAREPKELEVGGTEAEQWQAGGVPLLVPPDPLMLAILAACSRFVQPGILVMMVAI